METATAETVRDELYKENQHFRELVEQHKEYEQRLTELAELTYPSDEEQLEETTLKKKKLQVKDQIYSMIYEHSNLE